MPRRRPARVRPRRLTMGEILEWADAYHARHGCWPTAKSGEVGGCPWTTWRQVENALVYGFRGLRSGASIAKLLAKHRRKRNPRGLPDLSERQILEWADARFGRTGASRGRPAVNAD